MARLVGTGLDGIALVDEVAGMKRYGLAISDFRISLDDLNPADRFWRGRWRRIACDLVAVAVHRERRHDSARKRSATRRLDRGWDGHSKITVNCYRFERLFYDEIKTGPEIGPRKNQICIGNMDLAVSAKRSV